MPAAPIIIAAATYSGVATAIGTAIVGGTVLAGAATAVGVGVISGVSTAIQGGSSSDILKSAVLGGVSSYVGGAVASQVTSSVAGYTGASLVDLEPALRSLSGEGITAAGAASIVAGNVAGAAAASAITGRPIEQGALLGLAQSIPTALTASSDYNKLNPVVQNVLASSAQAAVMGQDIGDAALAALVSSSGIVAKAINEIPGGQDFIKNNPIYSKYIIDSVSSALTAQLQGKDVSESVMYSLARTTADVLKDEFKNTEKQKQVDESRAIYEQALKEEENLQQYVKDYNALFENPDYKWHLQNVENAIAQVNAAATWYDASVNDVNYYADAYNRTPVTDEATRAQMKALYDNAVNNLKNNEAAYYAQNKVLNRADNDLRRTGFNDEQGLLQSRIDESKRLLDGYSTQLEDFGRTLSSTSNQFFTDFESKVSPVFLPSDIGPEVAGDVNRDAIRGTFVVPFAGESFYDSDIKSTVSPAPGQDWNPYEMTTRFVSGYKDDGTPYRYAINVSPFTGVTYQDYGGAADVVAQRQAAYDEFAQYDTAEPGQDGIGTGAGIGLGDASQVGTGTGAGTGAGTGVPPIDYSLAAPDGSKPFPTIGLNLLTAGTGVEGGSNRALFNPRGGFGGTGGLEETTWSLVTRASETGTNDVVDVGGKLYSLVMLPDRQVLVPKEPTPVEVFIEVRQDPTTNTPVFEEVEADKVPAEIYLEIAKEMAKETGAPAGGAVTGAEGTSGGREGVPGDAQPATGTEAGSTDAITGAETGAGTTSGGVGIGTEGAANEPAKVMTPDELVAQQILKMAVGQIPADMQYDLNKDGKITSADALAYAQGQRPIAAAPAEPEKGVSDAEIYLDERTDLPPQKSADEIIAEQILQMAVGRIPPDMQYDLNNDGRITSADALAYAQGQRPGGGGGGGGALGSVTDPSAGTGEAAAPGGGGGLGSITEPSGGTGTTTEPSGGGGLGSVTDPSGGFGGGTEPGGGEGGEIPGGGEGTGIPGGEGDGSARGEEGTGTGVGSEGEGIGQGGDGTGTGEGEGDGTGEGGGTTSPSTSNVSRMFSLGALAAAAAAGGDYKPTTPGETWLGGLFRGSGDTTAGFRRMLGLEPEAQEANVYSALRQASGIPDNLARPSSFYSYGKDTSPADIFKFYRRGGTVQDDPPNDKMPMSPLLMSHGDIPHKGSHYVNGAGGGQDDLIPAQLADGEYVLDAEIVAALGDGSSKEGAKRLDKFREAIRKHKRTGSLKDIPPKAKSPLAYLRSIR